MNNIQHAAASIVSQVMQGRNLNQVLREEMKKTPDLTPQQRGALQDLSFGTLRFYGQLTKILDALLKKPLTDTYIHYLLLVALYQLQYSKAAQHAVVDFAVEAARNSNPAVSGLVNAVLRNYLRQKNAVIAQAAQTDEGLYSYPQWWIDEVRSQYKEQAESILLAGNHHPPMTLRVNHKRITTERYLALLNQNNIPATQIEPDALLLQHPVAVEKLPGFMEGMCSVQDAGAQYAARFLDVQDGMRVLDACSAPGGKSAHILESADAILCALDKDEHRLERVRENLQRLQLTATVLTGDAAEPATWWDGQRFQRILADVPCSATGVVRRHPDIKWLRRASDIEGFALQQMKIITALWPLLEAGGKLLYATCSVFGRENQRVMDEFLARHADAVQLSLSAPDMRQGQLLPNDQHDGFFYALLQKRN